MHNPDMNINKDLFIYSIHNPVINVNKNICLYNIHIPSLILVSYILMSSWNNTLRNTDCVGIQYACVISGALRVMSPT